MQGTSLKEIQLEQALLSVIAAADQFGADPEVLRFMAIGGLTQVRPAAWVIPAHIPGAIDALTEAVSAYSARPDEQLQQAQGE